LPVTCELEELEALPGELLDAEPEPIDPLLDEPEEPVPREPDEPLDPLDFDGSDGSDGLVAEPELLPDDPLPIDPLLDEPDEPVPDEPLDPPAADCAPAGSAMRRPAIPRPASMPLFTFMVFPSRLLRG
jgi:hypothetical protein